MQRPAAPQRDGGVLHQAVGRAPHQHRAGLVVATAGSGRRRQPLLEGLAHHPDVLGPVDPGGGHHRAEAVGAAGRREGSGEAPGARQHVGRRGPDGCGHLLVAARPAPLLDVGGEHVLLVAGEQRGPPDEAVPVDLLAHPRDHVHPSTDARHQLALVGELLAHQAYAQHPRQVEELLLVEPHVPQPLGRAVEAEGVADLVGELLLAPADGGGERVVGEERLHLGGEPPHPPLEEVGAHVDAEDSHARDPSGCGDGRVVSQRWSDPAVRSTAMWHRP